MCCSQQHHRSEDGNSFQIDSYSCSKILKFSSSLKSQLSTRFSSLVCCLKFEFFFAIFRLLLRVSLWRCSKLPKALKWWQGAEKIWKNGVENIFFSCVVFPPHKILLLFNNGLRYGWVELGEEFTRIEKSFLLSHSLWIFFSIFHVLRWCIENFIDFFSSIEIHYRRHHSISLHPSPIIRKRFVWIVAQQTNQLKIKSKPNHSH